MAHDLFISYSMEDKKTADAACNILESNGIRCWIAPRDSLPSVSYAESIIDAINNSRLLVIIFSSSSNQSPQVLREINQAVKKAIPVLPFRIEDVEPTKAMEYYLNTPHWLDALTPPLKKHLEKLASSVQLLLEDGSYYSQKRQADNNRPEILDDKPEGIDVKKRESRYIKKPQLKISTWLLLPAITLIVLFASWYGNYLLNINQAEHEGQELLRVTLVKFSYDGPPPETDNRFGFGADLLFTNSSSSDVVVTHIFASADISEAFTEEISPSKYMLTQGTANPTVVPANSSVIINVGPLIFIDDLSEKGADVKQGQVDVLIKWEATLTSPTVGRIATDVFYGGTLYYKDGKFFGRGTSPHDILIVEQ